MATAASSPPRRVLTIAGSDSGGGAGIQADLKTFAAHGVYGLSAVTAVTAQNSQEVRAVAPVPPQVVAAQIEAVLDDFGADAVKIGMLWSAGTVRAVAATLRGHPALATAAGRRAAIVLDPVMAAGTGASLLGGEAEEAIAALIEELLPLATLVTPNLPELVSLVGALRPPPASPAAAVDGDVPAGSARAAVLAPATGATGSAPAAPAEAAAAVAAAPDAAAGGERERLALARQLATRGPAVLAKGGHDPGPPASEVVDLLLVPAAASAADGQAAEQVVRFAAPRLLTRATHGTGCTLSAAIAARLAAGEELAAAVGGAIAYVRSAMAAAPALGAGAGPLDHFFGNPGGL